MNNDRKGRITRQGPARLRKILCQSAWVGVIHCEETAKQYHRIKGAKSNRTKKALVAVMRKLAIKMWHRALSTGVHEDLFGRGGPHADSDSAPAPQKGLAARFPSPSSQPLDVDAG